MVIGGRLLDRDAPRNAALLLAPYLLAIPFAIAPLLNASGSGALKLDLGWESAPLADGPVAVIFFYVTNLGVPFVLAICAALRARPAGPCLPGCLGHGALRHPERDAGQ